MPAARTVDPVDVNALLVKAANPASADTAEPVTDVADDGDAEASGPPSLRRQLIPHEIAATLWIGATIAHHWPHTAADVEGLYLSAAVLWWFAKGRKGDAETRGERRRRWAMWALPGAGWLMWAAEAGAEGPRLAALAIGGAVVALPFWLRGRAIPDVAEPVEEPPAPAPMAVVERDPVVDRWKAKIGRQGGPLSGARLGVRETLPGGVIRYPILLVSGEQTTGDACNAVVQIASAFGRSLADISALPDPSGVQDRAVLVITPPKANPLMVPQTHPGWAGVYNSATGMLKGARYTDGSYAPWGLHVPGVGLHSGFVCGSVRTGKSTFMESNGMGAQSTGTVQIWPGCPVGGASLPVLLDGAEFPARSRERMLIQLRAACTAMDIRGAWMGLLDQTVHTPTPQAPSILLVWDEVHRLWRDPWWGQEEAIELAARVAQEGPKFSVGMWAADQTPGIEVFGMSEALRSNLQAAQTMLFRSSSQSAGALIAGCEVDPSQLPRVWSDGTATRGLGILVGSGVAAQCRGLLPDLYVGQMAEMPHPTLEPWVEAGLAAKLGAAWTDRQKAAEGERYAAVAKRLDGLPDDVLDTMAAADPRVAAAVEAHRRHRATTVAAPTTKPEPVAARWFEVPEPPSVPTLRLVSPVEAVA